MSLPILVPTTLELPLLGMAVRARHVGRRLHWRAHVANRCTSSSPRRERRSHRFVPRTSAEVRAERLAHWQWGSANLLKLATSPAPAPAPAISMTRTKSMVRNLLRRGETLLKRLLRRRQRAPGVSPSALALMASTFDTRTWRVRVEPAQRETLAFMLVSMYWRGCRHPASLSCPPLHPSTALVRWISRFPVDRQVDHGREILDLFAAEEARVHDFACQLVDRLLPKTTTLTRAVPLLPEMIRAIEPEDASNSRIFTTIT